MFIDLVAQLPQGGLMGLQYNYNTNITTCNEALLFPYLNASNPDTQSDFIANLAVSTLNLGNLITNNINSSVIKGDTNSDLICDYAINDTINGGTGNDTIFAASGDTINGGKGNNTYYINDPSELIYQSPGGTNTVIASVNYTLGTNLENLTLTGSSNLVGTGNTAGSNITGIMQ